MNTHYHFIYTDAFILHISNYFVATKHVIFTEQIHNMLGGKLFLDPQFPFLSLLVINIRTEIYIRCINIS